MKLARKSRLFLWLLFVVGCCAPVMLTGGLLANKLFAIGGSQDPQIGANIHLTKKWCSSLDGLIVTQLTIGNGLIYVRLPNSIVAIQEDTGVTQWRFGIADD